LHIFTTWPPTAKPEELKGLRLIQAILKYKGTKRFRTKYCEEKDDDVFLSDEIDVNEAQARLTKMYNTSVYTAEYGAKAEPKFSEQTSILAYKKFSELPFSSMLTEPAKKALDGWLALNDQDVYKASVLNTLRTLYSLVRIRTVSYSTYTDHYQYNRGLVVPNERIDKRLFAKTVVPQPSSAKPKKTTEEVPLEESAPKEKAETNQAGVQGTSLLNPAAIRKELLRGNGYITASCFVPDKISNYQDTFKNPVGSKQVQKVKYDYFTSMATGGVCPDPAVISNFFIHLLENSKANKDKYIADMKLASQTGFGKSYR
jgi:hypothetical protein